MAATARKRRATYEDLLQVPDNFVAEILGGELYASPRPASPHALASSGLQIEIGGPFHRGRGGPGGWWILFEPELHFGEDILVPDLAGWRRERMPAVPKVPFFTLAPDWACDVGRDASRKVAPDRGLGRTSSPRCAPPARSAGDRRGRRRTTGAACRPFIPARVPAPPARVQRSDPGRTDRGGPGTPRAAR